MRAYWVIGGWALLQIWHLAGKATSDVAYGAHVGGLAVGALLFLVMRPAGVKLFECMRPGNGLGAGIRRQYLDPRCAAA